MSSRSTFAAETEQDWELHARRLRANVDAVVDLAGSLEAHQKVPSVLEQVCEAVEGSGAMLLRIDGHDVVIEGFHDIDGETVVPDWRGRLDSQPLLRSAHQSGEVVVGGSIDDAGFPTELRGAIAGVRHTLVVPLHGAEGVDGFLVVLRTDGRPFTPADAGTLRQLGNVALLALRNSRLYAEALTASEAMSQFLNLVAHDIRAPLTVVSGYLELLRDGTYGPPPATWAKPIDLITAKLRELHRLVEDILLAARLESGAAPMTSEVIDLNDAILRAGARSQARAALCGATVQTVPSAAPVAAFAVGFHVDRILDNLVNNAISYGGAAPSIRISVDASHPPAIRVEDHGVGIPKELHERIFERFFRLENPIPGTGFGLYVGWVLAHACGGSLHVERSAPGRGSVFRLELPAAAPTPA